MHPISEARWMKIAESFRRLLALINIFGAKLFSKKRELRFLNIRLKMLQKFIKRQTQTAPNSQKSPILQSYFIILSLWFRQVDCWNNVLHIRIHILHKWIARRSLELNIEITRITSAELCRYNLCSNYGSPY